MKTLISINCAGREKLPLLWQTLSSLLNIKLPADCMVRVNYNSSDVEGLDSPNEGQGWRTLQQLFKASGVGLQLSVLPHLSVAQMYREALLYAIEEGYDCILKLDDDCHVKDIDHALELSKNGSPYVSMNFWDIENVRGYDDWRPSVRVSELDQMVKTYGPRTVWCHRWLIDAHSDASYVFRKEDDVNASLFALRTDSVPHTLLEDLNSIGKGERGMDKVVGDAYRTLGRVHSLVSCAWHLGVYRPQLDGKYWTSYKEGYDIPQSSPILNQDNGRGTKLFVGKEVEHTPFYGQDTLFVQGLVDLKLVLTFIGTYRAQGLTIDNVYLGAGGLSQLDTSLIPQLLAIGVNVTVEAVVFPDEADRVLLSDRVALVIPITNEGRYQPNAIKAIIAWYQSDHSRRDKVRFKIDTDEPKVLIFSPHKADGLTTPGAYTSDKVIEFKSEADLIQGLMSWID